MNIKKIAYLALALLIFFINDAEFYKKTTPDLSIEAICPKKLVPNEDLPIHITAFSETEYIENIDVVFMVDGLSVDKLAFSRSYFKFESKFDSTIFLRFDDSQINEGSKVFVLFTLRDKYGNISKTNCEY